MTSEHETEESDRSQRVAMDQIVGDPEEFDLVVELQPVTENDVAWLYELETHPDVNWRFRLGGKVLPVDQYQRSIAFSNILDQAIVTSKIDGRRVGLVYADNCDAYSGTAEFGFVSHPDFAGSALVLIGLLLFLDRLFRQFSLRKLIGQTAEFNLNQFVDRRNKDGNDFSTVFSLEVVFPNFYFFDGRYWDRYQAGIAREDWLRMRPKMIESAVEDSRRARDAAAVGHLFVQPEANVYDRTPTLGLIQESTYFALRPPIPQDGPWCNALMAAGLKSHSLRIGCVTVGPAQVQAQLWMDTLCTFVAVDRANGFPVAVFCCYQASAAHLNAYVHAFVDPSFAQMDVCSEAAALFIKYVFSAWAFRKLYIRYAVDAPELGLWRRAITADGESLWVDLGVQRSQLVSEGRPIDVTTCELNRDAWDRCEAVIWQGLNVEPGIPSKG
jgi:RimJ/RimL family protein N-acetyltransferase